MRLLDVVTSPWAMEPGRFNEMVDIYLTHLRGEKIDIGALEARLGGPLPGTVRGYDIQDGVAVLPIDGVIAKKMNMLMKVSGGTSLEMLGSDLAAALADSAAHSIVLLVDSPGGATMGLQEVGDAIFAARQGNGGKKPIIALTDGMMASAAYWLGSAADAVYISSDTTLVGSIGVIYQHIDKSGADSKSGVKRTDVYAGKYKTMTSDAAPLSDEARADLQGKVDTLYSLFVNTVARNRGVDAAAVNERMAEGRIFLGKEAVQAGLVDGVSTLQGLISSLNSGGAAALPAARNRMTAGVAVPEAAIPQPDSERTVMDKNFILANHPDIAEAFRTEGFQRGLDQGRTEGATAERGRIQAVQAQSMPGHGELIATLMFDGKTTGPEAAVQVLGAERGKLGKVATNLEVDAAGLRTVKPDVAADPALAAAAAVVEEQEKPLEERCKAAWDKDANLRAEYGGMFDAYLGFEKNKGNVRILGKKAA